MKRTFVPQHSLKVNDFCKLLIINCNLPQCQEKFIEVAINDREITIQTPKFSKHFLTTMKIPEYCTLLPESVQTKHTGQLYNITYKVTIDESKIPMKEVKYHDNPSTLVQSEMLADDNATRTGIPAVVKPAIIESKSKGKFTTQPLQKTRVLSNMINKKLKSESEVLKKIAEIAIKKETEKRSVKLDQIEHKEKQISDQLEARETRKTAKRTQAKNKKDSMLKTD
ncbi:hypothetical protein SS50377_22275 [Spironucleus salmonicida]|uniref:Uncharacterized protein n=1 Tax=Spironucleus salmonicida TaxID=348837 RepID=V6LEX9_9EUKA|nr:hypothetical protein SS50377_22275 [Spironucleus salmonicida]|eukprot:EST42231.1 Hypothetical protein SS50377_18533 [Spironucleus salmonicida]